MSSALAKHCNAGKKHTHEDSAREREIARERESREGELTHSDVVSRSARGTVDPGAGQRLPEPGEDTGQSGLRECGGVAEALCHDAAAAGPRAFCVSPSVCVSAALNPVVCVCLPLAVQVLGGVEEAVERINAARECKEEYYEQRQTHDRALHSFQSLQVVSRSLSLSLALSDSFSVCRRRRRASSPTSLRSTRRRWQRRRRNGKPPRPATTRQRCVPSLSLSLSLSLALSLSCALSLPSFPLFLCQTHGRYVIRRR